MSQDITVQQDETVPLEPIVVGRYVDAFGGDGGGWLFAECLVDVEMLGDVSAHLLVDRRPFD